MSYEKEIKDKYAQGKVPEERIKMSPLRYFWERSIFARGRKRNLSKFLRDIRVLSHFTESELLIFSRYLHIRHFGPKEVIFQQDDHGFGFYIIYMGKVEIWARPIEKSKKNDISEDDRPTLITTLEKHDTFGETALLEEFGLRTASAVSFGNSSLLGLFRPDMEELVRLHPVIAAKLLQAISFVLVHRLSSAVSDIKSLKQKIVELERNG